MGTRLSFILLLFLCSIPFSLINMIPAFKGNMPDITHMTTSVIAVVLLFIVGLLLGYNGQSFFVRWFLLYWGIGLLFLTLGYVTKSLLLLLPFAFIYAFPLYGLRFLLSIPSDMTLVLICTLIAIVVGMFGYFLGHYRNKKASSVTE